MQSTLLHKCSITHTQTHTYTHTHCAQRELLLRVRNVVGIKLTSWGLSSWMQRACRSLLQRIKTCTSAWFKTLHRSWVWVWEWNSVSSNRLAAQVFPCSFPNDLWDRLQRHLLIWARICMYGWCGCQLFLHGTPLTLVKSIYLQYQCMKRLFLV